MARVNVRGGVTSFSLTWPVDGHGHDCNEEGGGESGQGTRRVTAALVQAKLPTIFEQQ